MCALLAGVATMLSGAITCSNIFGELWRAPMALINAISHAKWHLLKLSRSQRTLTSRLGSKILIINAQLFASSLDRDWNLVRIPAAALPP